MRKTLSIILSILSLTLMAQTPQGVGYQGVATDANGIELVNQSISIRASVLSGSATGTIEWEETHTTTTDTFGLFALTIGQGTNTTNGTQTSFADISWGTNTHYLKIEMDVTGGTNYSFMGTNQMMSVPYALYAESANINYDSISNLLSNDSTFITNVGGGMGGGGCDWKFPDGLDGEPFTVELSGTSTYTPQTGKRLYVFRVVSAAVTVDGIYTDNPTYLPLILNNNQTLGVYNSTGTSSVYGYLVDENPNVEAITMEITGSTTYSPPIGKRLYVCRTSQSQPSIDGAYSSPPANIPMILSNQHELGVWGGGSNIMAFNGYLVDENYFAGCGGGGSSSSASINYDSLANIISMDSSFLANINGNCNTFGEPIESQAQWFNFADTTLTYAPGFALGFRTNMNQVDRDGILVVSFGNPVYQNLQIGCGIYHGADTSNMYSTLTFDGALEDGIDVLTIPLRKDDYYFLVSGFDQPTEIIFFPFECANNSSSSSSSLDSTTIANMIANSVGGNMAFGDIIPLDPNWSPNPNDSTGFNSYISEWYQVESDGFLILNDGHLGYGDGYCVYYGADTNNLIPYCSFSTLAGLASSATLPIHKDYFYFLTSADAYGDPIIGYFLPLESGGGSSSANNNGSQLNIETREFSTSFSALTTSDTIYISQLIGDTVDRLSVEIIDVVWSSISDQDVILGLYSNDNSLTTNYGQVEIRGDLNGETVLQGYPRSPSSSGAKAMKKLMISAENPYLLFTPYSYIGTGGSGVITFWITTTF